MAWHDMFQLHGVACYYCMAWFNCMAWHAMTAWHGMLLLHGMYMMVSSGTGVLEPVAYQDQQHRARVGGEAARPAG